MASLNLTSALLGEDRQTINEIVKALFSSGTHENITITYGTDSISLSPSGSGAGHTNEEIQDIVASLIGVGDGITTVYNDTNNTLTISLSGEEYSLAEKNKLVSLDADIQSKVNANTSKRSYPTEDQTKVGLITVTANTNLDTIRDAIDGLSSSVVLKGDFDASLGVFPTATKAGETWIISVAGTIDGVDFSDNDRILAIADLPSTSVYAGNWLKLDYTDQVLSVAGKTGAIILTEADISDLKDYIETSSIGVSVQPYNENTLTAVPNATQTEVGGVKQFYDAANDVWYLTADGTDATPVVNIIPNAYFETNTDWNFLNGAVWNGGYVSMNNGNIDVTFNTDPDPLKITTLLTIKVSNYVSGQIGIQYLDVVTGGVPVNYANWVDGIVNGNGIYRVKIPNANATPLGNRSTWLSLDCGDFDIEYVIGEGVTESYSV